MGFENNRLAYVSDNPFQVIWIIGHYYHHEDWNTYVTSKLENFKKAFRWCSWWHWDGNLTLKRCEALKCRLTRKRKTRGRENHLMFQVKNYGEDVLEGKNRSLRLETMITTMVIGWGRLRIGLCTGMKMFYL